MLDVIVTISDTTPKRWVHECLRSVEVAIAHAGYSINLIKVPGVPGSIGQAMANGLAVATADYVLWVDDDDFVLPNAFACFAKHWTYKPSAIYAREMRLYANGRIEHHMQRHHPVALRREFIASLNLQTYPTFASVAVRKATDGVAIDELSWVYVYRVWKSAGFYLRSTASDEQRKLLA